MKTELPMSWFNTFKIIMLVAGIMGTVGIIFTGAGIALLSVFKVRDFEGMKTLYIQCIVGNIILTTVFYITYCGLKKYKKIGLNMIYTQNVLIPVFLLALIPAMNNYFNKFFVFLQSSSDIMLMQKIFSIIIPLQCIFWAVVMLILLTLNSKYFYKRKEVFQ